MLNIFRIDSKDVLFEIYTHELLRVFSDRLTSDKDLDVLYSMTEKGMKILGSDLNRESFKECM